MNYLICRCNLFYVEQNVELKSGVVYELEKEKSLTLSNLSNGACCHVRLDCPNGKVKVANYKADKFYLIDAFNGEESYTFSISHKDVEYVVTVGRTLFVFSNGKSICEKQVEDIVYSKNSTFGDYLLLHFDGKRKYIVVLKNGECVFADFLDEYNAGEKEKYFMCKACDCLNHGKVLKLTESTDENYLVYLDDYDMQLKSKFVSCVFMDALKIKNYKYCNQLLKKDLQQTDVENIKNFFPTFDDVINLKENVFALTQKNAIAGIFEFFVEDNLIVNINSLL